nr:hypothetical protein [uncultured Acinetobacter sp.]
MNKKIATIVAKKSPAKRDSTHPNLSQLAVGQTHRMMGDKYDKNFKFSIACNTVLNWV